MRATAFATILAANIAWVRASDLLTYTSTILSPTCSSASTKAYYGNHTVLNPESFLYETEYVTNQDTLTMLQTVCSDDSCHVATILNTLTTVTATVDGVLTTYVTASPYTVTYNDEATVTLTPTEFSPVPTSTAVTVSTITSCSANKCDTKVITKSMTTVTSMIDGQNTVYTTFCPVSDDKGTKIVDSSASSDSFVPITTNKAHASELDANMATSTVNFDQSTTKGLLTAVVTVTSCFDKSCSAIPVTTGISLYTSTIGGAETVYTTYCPLPESVELSTEPENPAHTTLPRVPTKSAVTVETFSPVETLTTGNPVVTTVNVITNNIVTKAEQSAFKSASTATSETTVHIISYEGAAARTLPLILAIPIVYLLV